MGGLELLNKPGLWLLAGLVPLVVLYILKIKRERMRVPSTWLWAAARRDLLSKQPFKRLIAELPLILQILALVALAIALSRPSTRGGRISGDHVAIVVDTSASMGTIVNQGGKSTTRLELARASAIDIVNGLPPGADAMIVEGARDAKLLSPLERDPKRLKVALGQLGVREVEGDLSAAVALAADRLRSLGGVRKIVVLTDGALAHEAPLSAAGIPTQVLTVGGPEENAAIVRIDVRSGVDPATKREQAQTFVLAQNFGTKPRDAFVTLTIAGRTEPAASRRVLIPPGEKVPVVLTFEPKAQDQGEGLVVQLSPGDALPSDDVAYGRVPKGQKMPVTIASRAPYAWLTRALEADPNVSIQRLTVDQLGTVNVEPDALVVVEGACPESVPGLDVVVAAPPEGQCFGIDVGPRVEQPQLTSWESGDARLRFLTLDGVHVAHATELKAEGAQASLVRAGKATLIADASSPGRSVTIIGFDPGESDWPLKASFVLFVRNVVEMARVHRTQGAGKPVRTGDPLRVSVPAGVTSVKVEGPGMVEHDVPAKAGFAIVPAVERAGIYRVRWTTPRFGSVLIPANLTSEKESDIRPKPIAVEAGSGEANVSAARSPDAQNEWGKWLALFATLLLLFDVWWITRRVRAPAASAISPGGTKA
jgi:hypothetical protein